MPDEQEQWRAISGFDYEVSSFGRVRRATCFKQFPAGYVLKCRRDKDGYPVVALARKGGYRYAKISVLVAEAFIGTKPSFKHHAAHWDGDKTNNRSTNLRWATPSENEKDKTRQGKRADTRGEKHPMHVLTEAKVRQIRLDRKAGIPVKEIAAAYGVGRLTVYDVVRGVTWTHV